MKRLACLLAVLVVIVGGCSSPSGTIQVSSAGITPTGAGTVYASGTSVSLGAAIAFSAQALDSNGAMTAGSVSVMVDDDQIAQLLPTTTPNQFVLVGAAVGTTTLHLNANRSTPTAVPVSVVAQVGQ